MPAAFFAMFNPSITTPVFWLQDANHSAYLVGNQVRDQILNIVTDSHDVDIATTALPQEVVGVLRKNNIIPRIVDEKFGVVSFHFEGYDFEATTLRQDLYLSDLGTKRYPDQIKFVKLLAQDALRRDYTINAVYWNPKTKQHLDYVGGLDDLESKTLRCIGDPQIRLAEDPLRILRAIRFRHLLGFQYEPTLQLSLIALAPTVHKLSPGVLGKEFDKIRSLSQAASAQAELKKLGISL